MSEPYARKIYFGIAMDPIHVGTGGYTLGKVDNPTIRDFDGIPKIPGTSIEGTTRAYTAIQFGQPMCASKEEHKSKCPYKNINCRICVSFGYADSKLVDKPKSLQGMALFSDAKILFFPVASLVGPIWVICPSRLMELNVDKTKWDELEESEFCIISDYLRNKIQNVKYLNFGWLLLALKVKDGQTVTHQITPETTFEIDGNTLKFKDRGLNKREIFNRLVIVSDSVFSQIVNSNLEVRTSVSIDPQTGAAEPGALFTYEAIPRTTIFYFDVVYQNPKHFGLNFDLNDIISTVETGFDTFEFLGVGGMGTRGFGKLKVLGLDKKLDKIELSRIQAENVANKVKELKERLSRAKPEERALIEKDLQKLLEKIKQVKSEYQKILSIWTKTLEKEQK